MLAADQPGRSWAEVPRETTSDLSALSCKPFCRNQRRTAAEQWSSLLRDSRWVARYVQAAGDQVMVTEARRLEGDSWQQAGVACRRQQQIEHGLLYVLHQVVAVQQVVQVGVKLTVAAAGADKIAAHDESLLGHDELVAEQAWTYDLLQVCHCIYRPILYYFRDKARHWSKITTFHTPAMHLTPPLGGRVGKYHDIFDNIKYRVNIKSIVFSIFSILSRKWQFRVNYITN